jgi:hypothetical protein
MTSVYLLFEEPGRLTIPVGRIDFYALPIQGNDDFYCTPWTIVSFNEALAISVKLSQGADAGSIGRYVWRRTT